MKGISPPMMLVTKIMFIYLRGPHVLSLQARYQIQLIYTWVSFIHVSLSGLRLHFHEGSQKDSSPRFQKSILSILEIQY